MTSDVGVFNYDGKQIKTFDYESGLPDHDIYKVERAQDGNLYFLPSNGIPFLHNGTSFEILESVSTNPDFISDVLITSSFRAWSSFGNGVVVEWPDGIRRYLSRGDPGYTNVTMLWQKSDTALFALTAYGIEEITPSGVYDAAEVPDRVHISRSCHLPDGRVLFNSRNALWAADHALVLTRFELDENWKGMEINRIRYVDGKVSVCSDNGLWFASIQGDSLVVLDHVLRGIRVSDICEDHEHRLWVSTLEKGVYRLSNPFVHRLRQCKAYAMSLKDDTLYIGGGNGEIHKYIGGKYWEVDSLEASPQLRVDKIREVMLYGDTTYYRLEGSIVARHGQTQRKLNVGIAHLRFLEDYVLIGNQVGVWEVPYPLFLDSLFNAQQTMSFTNCTRHLGFKVTDMLVRGEEVILATDAGLKSWSAEKGVQDYAISELTDVYITDLASFGDDLYMATLGRGVFRLSSGKLDHISQDDGLPSNFVTALAISNQAALVCGGHGFISVFDCAQGQFAPVNHFSRHDGVPGSRVEDLQLDGNDVYIATSTGVYGFDLTKERAELPQPWLEISDILVNDKPTKLGSLSDLNHREDRLEIRLHTVSFVNQEYLTYWYRLGKEEGGWREASDGVIQMSSLKPGEYDFEFKVCALDNCSEISRVSVSIAPPFWQTWWFRILIITSALLIVYLFFRIRVLTYNRDVVRELLQALLKRLKREEFIVLKDVRDGSLTQVRVSEIRYIKGANNYLEVFLGQPEPIKVRMTMSDMSDKLDNLKQEFIRCHRSYIVNVGRIGAVHGEFLKIDEKKIPLGKKYLSSISEKRSLLKKAR